MVGDTHVHEVVGSNPSTGYHLERSFFTISCSQIVMLLQKTENDKQKEAGDGPFQRATI